jgi:glyoxylase-like metal-dependent hydrolase (beta-lactamase superfamily II)
MLPVAQSLDPVLPGVWRWSAFSAEHKVELTSHAVVREGRLFVFDPIPLVASARIEFERHGQPFALVLTNENHERAAADWQERWQVPVWAGPGAALTLPGLLALPVEQGVWEGWRLHDLRGGAGGELALRWAEQSLVVFGDAVFNLPRHGFDLLPEKYCRDHRALRDNLRPLAADVFERAVFAHGAPLLQRASDRLSALLDAR